MCKSKEIKFVTVLDFDDKRVYQYAMEDYSIEEYEYCSELKELITAKNSADLDMFLDKLAEENGITMY